MKDAFTWACEFGRTDVVQCLIERGMDPSARLKHHGQTGLHWAASGGHLDTVNVLLRSGAPVNAKDDTWGGTPIDWVDFGRENNTTPGMTPARYDDVIAVLSAAGGTRS